MLDILLNLTALCGVLLLIYFGTGLLDKALEKLYYRMFNFFDSFANKHVNSLKKKESERWKQQLKTHDDLTETHENGTEVN